MIDLLHFLPASSLAAAVTRGVSRRLGSFEVSWRVFDNFNGAESPWVRLVALLDLSETRPPVRASGLEQKSASPIQKWATDNGRPFLDRLENDSPFLAVLAYPREMRPFLDNGLQGV